MKFNHQTITSSLRKLGSGFSRGRIERDLLVPVGLGLVRVARIVRRRSFGVWRVPVFEYVAELFPHDVTLFELAGEDAWVDCAIT